MKYKGKELVEMTTKMWDGKSREMLVWDDKSDTPIIKEIVGYTQSDIHSDNIIWIDNRGNRYSHCAEIPKENFEMPGISCNKCRANYQQQLIELEDHFRKIIWELKDKIHELELEVFKYQHWGEQ